MDTRKNENPRPQSGAPANSRDDAIDEAIAESFPASDPPANTVETAVRLGPEALVAEVVDNTALHRFELSIGAGAATLIYKREPGALRLVHTEVPAEVRGQHLGEALVLAAVGVARREQRQVVAICPFARAYLERHPKVLG